MDDFLISIIIPYYNRPDLLIYTLESIENVMMQADIKLETIVVDDGSDENYKEQVFKSHNWITFIRQNNQGASHARNHGLRIARGKYILYLDSDDLIERNFFEDKITQLETNTNLAGVYGPFDYFSTNTTFREQDIIPRHQAYPLIPNPEFTSHLKRLLEGWFIPCNAVLWRKKVLDRIGGQDESLKINQDVDLMFRILVNKNNIAGVPGGRALVRSHDGDRVGVLGLDESKLNDIYALRERFKNEMVTAQLYTSEMRESLARYCFNSWAASRKESPEIAKKFLGLSNELFPELKIKGRWYYRMLGTIFGKTNAVEIKESLRRLMSGPSALYIPPLYPIIF